MEVAFLASLYDWFDRFVAGYVGETPEDQRNYDLKVEHTRQVCAIMRRLAATEGLPPEEQHLAEAVALCHDVGRFPQYRQYRTFNDPASANHATLAVRILKGADCIIAIPQADRELLLAAVALHNVFRLPDTLTPQQRRLGLLIRDADKLDIWRVLIEHCTAPVDQRASAVTWELPETGACSPQTLEAVQARQLVDRRLLVTADDFKLLQLSWVFDLNFSESFAILAERGYIESLATLLPRQQGCAEAVAEVRSYVSARRHRFSEKANNRPLRDVGTADKEEKDEQQVDA